MTIHRGYRPPQFTLTRRDDISTWIVEIGTPRDWDLQGWPDVGMPFFDLTMTVVLPRPLVESIDARQGRGATGDLVGRANAAGFGVLDANARVSGDPGRVIAIHGLVAASFERYTPGPDTLTVRSCNAIFARVPCLDGQWRELDEASLHNHLSAAAAEATAVLDTACRSGVEARNRAEWGGTGS